MNSNFDLVFNKLFHFSDILSQIFTHLLNKIQMSCNPNTTTGALTISAHNESTEALTLCKLCETIGCESTGVSISSALNTSIGAFNAIPTEVLALIVNKLSLNELSVLSLTNKWFRDFVCEYYLKSKTGLQALLNGYQLVSTAATPEDREKRSQLFKAFGLVFKRTTCLFPTADRITLLLQVIERLDGIPMHSLNLKDNFQMRFIFQCYGQLIRQLIAGWDDSEVDYVFDVFNALTHSEQLMVQISGLSFGQRQTLEYYLRSFYRTVCFDTTNRCISETQSWLKRILRPFPLKTKAQLLIIIFGPLISLTQTPTTLPYIGWWDMTDTFFISHGLEDLGFALFSIYSYESIESVISLIDSMVKMPESWLMENQCTLLYYAGDEICYHYLMSKLRNTGGFAQSAQILVYLCLVTYKINKKTKTVLKLIERLCATEEHRIPLIRELPIAFQECVTDIDGVIELEEERDVTELHEIIAANNDLLMNLLFKCFKGSDSDETKDTSDSSDAKTDSTEE